MKAIHHWLFLLVKRLLFYTLPLLMIVLFLYEIIFKLETHELWPLILPIILYPGLLEVGRYRTKVMFYPVEQQKLEELEANNRWKVISKQRSSLTLRPRFDYPYSLLSGDKIHFRYREGVAELEGPQYYLEQLLSDIENTKPAWRSTFARRILPSLAILLLMLPVVTESGVYANFRVSLHNRQVQARQKLLITDYLATGNSESNINNYGYVAEYDGQLFYIEDYLNLARVSADFQGKTYLYRADSGTGTSSLNIMEGWIFYSQGKSLKRMWMDGTQNETIYDLGYLLDVHVQGNDIYFISFFDQFSVYKMDVNGQGLERFIDKSVLDIALYDNRLFYSYEEDGGGSLESVNLQGEDRRVELEVPVNSMTRLKDYFYFKGLGDDFRLYRSKVGGSEKPQVLIEEPVASHVVTEQGIYYSLQFHNGGHQGEDLLKVQLDGSGKTLLADTRYVEGLSHIGDWLFFRSVDYNGYTTHKRMNLQTNEITLMPE